MCCGSRLVILSRVEGDERLQCSQKFFTKASIGRVAHLRLRILSKRKKKLVNKYYLIPRPNAGHAHYLILKK